MPQTWHIPQRFHDVNPEVVEDTQVQTISNTKRKN